MFQYMQQCKADQSSEEATEAFLAPLLPQTDVLPEQQFQMRGCFEVSIAERAPIRMLTMHSSPCFFKVPEAQRVFCQLKWPWNIMSIGQHSKLVMSGGEPYNLSRNFQVQQTGDGIYLWMVGYQPGLPYLKHQKCLTSSSSVVARVYVRNSASAPRQTCP